MTLGVLCTVRTRGRTAGDTGDEFSPINFNTHERPTAGPEFAVPVAPPDYHKGGTFVPGSELNPFSPRTAQLNAVAYFTRLRQQQRGRPRPRRYAFHVTTGNVIPYVPPKKETVYVYPAKDE